MQSRDQEWQPRAIQVIELEALVPPNHMLRQLDRVLDMSFVRPLVNPLYSAQTGRPATAPERIVRMLLLEYLFNLSDVRLCQDVAMHAGYRWFCRLNFDDPVPDRTTLVKTRKRWAQAGVFEELMRRVVQQCIDAGLVQGDRIVVDGTQVTANAATNSLEPIAPVESLSEYVQRKCQEDGVEPPVQPKDSDPPEPPQRQAGNPDFHGERFSNRTHRSKTDRDARLYRKGANQEAKLRYLVHNLADVDSGVILSTKATEANGEAERAAALEMLDETLLVLPEAKKERVLLGDKHYRATEFVWQVLKRKLLPGFRMESEKEEEPTWKREPRTLQERLQRARKVRAVRVRNRVRALQGRRLTRRLMRARIRIEHLFGEAKTCHGLGRARSRGLLAMQTQALMTATVQNLKRLVAFMRRKAPSLPQLFQNQEQTGCFPYPAVLSRLLFGVGQEPCSHAF